MAAPTLNPSNPPQTDTSAKSQRKSKLRLLIPMGLVAIAATGTGIWYFMSRPVSGALRVSGRLEGYETKIGAKVPGRVEAVAVREGDQVRQGQVLVRLDDDEVQAQLRGAAAKVAAARQQEQQAKLQIDVVENQIREAQFNLQQSVGDATGRINQAASTVAAAKAQLAEAEAQAKQAESELKLAFVNRDRYADLVRQGAVNRQQFDQAQTAADTAQATLQARQAAILAAREQLSAAQGGLTQVQSTGYNPAIRNAQLGALARQRDRAYAQLKQAQADVKNAIAAQQQIQAQIAYLTVPSPINGVVTARSVEPGAVVASGNTLLTVIDLNQVYLRGFVPEGEIGKVRVGQQAKVFLDSDPNRPLTAKVAAIDPQASFTPENTYFRNDRVRQVFGVRLILDNPSGFAKPGMPADAEIALE